MASEPVKIVMGAAGFGNRDPYLKEDDIKEFFATLKAHNIDTIDTAQLYGKSEEKLGEANAGADFTFDTKWIGGFGPEGTVEDLIIGKGKESIEKLKVKQVSLAAGRLNLSVPIFNRSTSSTFTPQLNIVRLRRLSTASTKSTKPESSDDSASPTSPPKTSKKPTTTANPKATSSRPSTKVTTALLHAFRRPSSSPRSASWGSLSTPTVRWREASSRRPHSRLPTERDDLNLGPCIMGCTASQPI
jgi:hypothetical protein